ncbi:MAG: mechanosensitive ion channel family protein [Cyanobacteriota bacterium]
MHSKNQIRYFIISIIAIILLLICNNNVFAQLIPAPAPEATNTDTPKIEDPVIIKEPVDINDKTILYIGAKDKLAAKQRSLDIKLAIDQAIKLANKTKNISIDSEILQNGEDYTIYINNIPVVKVTDIDIKANEFDKNKHAKGHKLPLLDKFKLAKIWKSNIIELIKETKIIIEPPKTHTDYILEIGIALIILLLFLVLIEFIRNRISKLIVIIAAKILKRIDSLLNKIKLNNNKDDIKDNESSKNIDISDIDPDKDTIDDNINDPLSSVNKDKEELDNKINIITNEINVIINIISRAIELIAILIFIDYSLYVYPATQSYVSSFTYFMISVFEVVKEFLSEWLQSDDTWEGFGRIIMITIATTIVIYLIQIFGSALENIINVILENDKARAKRLQTIAKIIRTTLKILIIVLSLVLILSEIGVNVAPIIAGAGIIGLAISFGSQSLVKDIINGIFILIENQFGIGDVVSINGTGGVVEDMTLRVTILRDMSGKVYIIPNGQISTVIVSTKGWARANLDIGIAYKEDIDTAMAIIKDVADQMKKEFPEKIIDEPELLGVNELADSSVNIKLIMKTNPGEQWSVEREYRRRIKYALDEKNIEIPFPHTTLYIPQPVGYEKDN